MSSDPILTKGRSVLSGTPFSVSFKKYKQAKINQKLLIFG